MSSQKAIKKRRREVREKALAALAVMTLEELKNVRHELGKEMGIQARALDDLRQRLEAVKLEEQRRVTATPVGIHISDHAVVRYLERVKGFDVGALRAEIAEVAKAAKALRNGKSGQRQSDDGLVIGVDEIGQCVTTVFHERELPVLDVVKCEPDSNTPHSQLINSPSSSSCVSINCGHLIHGTPFN